MPFKYSCFVSYSHGQHELISTFVTDLTRALTSSLEPYLTSPPYIDAERLKAGYRFNESLADALCRSISMLVVYTPRWTQQEYCQREYLAMKQLEKRRRRVAGSGLPREYGMVIPVVLRGRREDLPEDIKQHRHYSDFSRYTTADTGIGSNSGYITQVDEIARYIYDLGQALEPLADDLCSGCSRFTLPAAIREPAPPRRQPFPGRAA